MHLLITGASGFLGRRCVERFGADGHQIVATWHTDRSRVPTEPAAGVRYEQCNLADATQVASLFAGQTYDAVIHAAARLPSANPITTADWVRSNVLGTAHLVDAVRTPRARFVYCSSISVYSDGACPAGGWTEDFVARPSHAYGWTKLAGEDVLRVATAHDGITSVALRLAGIHGPGRSSGVVYNVARQAIAGSPIHLRGSSQPFQLLYVDHAVDAIAAAITAPLTETFSVVNVASETVASLRELATRIVQVAGSRSAVALEVVSDACQVMDTTRLASVLGLHPGDHDAQLGQVLQWARG